MLSVYTRHTSDCPYRDDASWKRCRCPKWLDGTLPGEIGRYRRPQEPVAGKELKRDDGRWSSKPRNVAAPLWMVTPHHALSHNNPGADSIVVLVTVEKVRQPGIEIFRLNHAD